MNYQNKGTTSGLLNMLRPAYPETGLLFLENGTGVVGEAVDIGSITSIQLTGSNSFYNEEGVLKISLLPPPSALVPGTANSEGALRKYFAEAMEEGRYINVTAGGIQTGAGQVTAVGYGVAVIGEKTIFSTCAVEKISI
ncbi:hypothetical protein SDC9_199076 [bioreactor metagenome]|uniref:Uncharacterized protein n=1 Tax=bioreactor metagenome TaxID=1076179 RepID=A0A645IJH2_9ZZZZ